jgi:polyhydroxyalkanoate synthase
MRSRHEGLDETDKARVEFFARQMIDLFSPTNYLATNPDALERAVETEGMSLVQGLENMVRDIESHHGELLPTLADPAAFVVGGNIATTEGSVVYRNRMMELIQYAPTTETVHRTPLVIFPPWINKFYIMDLKPQNSLIRWIVDQGYTLFVVSWKNPDVSYADVGLEQYVEEGYLRPCASPMRSRARNRSTRSATASRARRCRRCCRF